MSPALKRFVRHVAASPGRDGEPLHMDDVVESLEDCSDAALSLICGEPAGGRHADYWASLQASCELRKRLLDELDDVDLSMPDCDGGWVDRAKLIVS